MHFLLNLGFVWSSLTVTTKKQTLVIPGVLVINYFCVKNILFRNKRKTKNVFQTAFHNPLHVLANIRLLVLKKKLYCYKTPLFLKKDRERNNFTLSVNKYCWCIDQISRDLHAEQWPNLQLIAALQYKNLTSWY